MDEIEKQETDPENPEKGEGSGKQEDPQKPEEGSDRDVDKDAKIKELEAEVTKYKRMAERRGKSSEKPSKSQPDDEVLERLDNLALKTAGIKGDDELELFNKWKEETGRKADDIIENSIFVKELEDIRTARAAQEATSDVKGEQGESGVKNTADYWIAKATKGEDGKLRFPEETPKELYGKILDKISEGESGSSEELKFYSS